jgi:hypothetical protein
MFQKKTKQQETKPKIPETPSVYPKWTFAKIENVYWLVLEKTRMAFISERACWSWGKPYVLASDKSLSKYKVWKKIGFAPGSLLKSMDGQFWFISGSDPLKGERQLITTPDFFNVLGFNPNNAIVVSQEELLFHQEGIPFDSISGK